MGAGTTVTNATIATNFSTLGSGFYNENTNQSSFLRNTIVAANTGGASDVFGAFSSSFNNLIGKSDGSTGLVNGANGNIVGTIAVPVNPQLNALGNNGGATQTHSFSSNTSLAINAGSNALAVDQNNLPLTTDQRGAGFQRINGTTVDIGAFESSAPTAASVEISGRITTADGRGIFNARITLTDATGQPRYALSNPFGYYRFPDVAVGETYIVAVSHKRFQFPQPVQILNLNEKTNNLNFTALPSK
ncbi:MAG: carboxypeptidase-like regulatory domain-containing protein [Pyrinomonadaceae bacterium]|nr:carboxypeptidase-like regulatory domain-containing protein [Pyrinomonadaceae bacterium]